MAKPPPISTNKIRCGQLVSGKYLLERRVGSGGNGVVWLATNTALKNHVILKFTINQGDEQLVLETSNLAMFSNRHPNIVNILDVGIHEGRSFIVIQFLNNGDLGKYIFNSGNPESIKSRVLHESPNWILGVAGALDYLHANQLIHKDVKPANILFDDSFSPYLSDFGLSKTVQEASSGNDGSIYGSLPYMSPELIQNGNATPLSDQFALAVTAFEFLTGSRPFQGKTSSEVLKSIKLGPPSTRCYRPEASAKLDLVFHKALHLDPDSRYSSCTSFVKDLQSSWPFSESAWQRSISHIEIAKLAGDTGPASSTTTHSQNEKANSDSNPAPSIESKSSKRIVGLDRLKRRIQDGQ